MTTLVKDLPADRFNEGFHHPRPAALQLYLGSSQSYSYPAPSHYGPEGSLQSSPKLFANSHHHHHHHHHHQHESHHHHHHSNFVSHSQSPLLSLIQPFQSQGQSSYQSLIQSKSSPSHSIFQSQPRPSFESRLQSTHTQPSPSQSVVQSESRSPFQSLIQSTQTALESSQYLTSQFSPNTIFAGGLDKKLTQYPVDESNSGLVDRDWGSLVVHNETLNHYSELNETAGWSAEYSHISLASYIVPALFALIFVVGVIGNGTLVIIFGRIKSLRSVPNIYIISLALGDLLVLLFTVPFVSTIYCLESWPFGDFMCRLTEFLQNVSVGVTVFTLTALSADRYLAIVSTVRRRSAEGARRRTVLAVVGIWLLAVVMALPSGIITRVETFIKMDLDNNNQTLEVCYPFPEDLPKWYPPAYVVLRALLYYLLPLGIIATFYMLMATHLLSVEDVPQESQTFNNHLRVRKKVAKIVLCFVVIFAVCFLPTHVFILWFHLQDFNIANDNFNQFWHILRIVGFCLSFMNSCINPIALYCISGNFRNHYNHYLFCCGHPSSHALLQPGSSAVSRCRSLTMRGTETIKMTTLIQERPSPATS